MLLQKLNVVQLLILAMTALLPGVANAQHKSYKLSSTGDTLNIVDKEDKKQGKWVNVIPELRGEPGYEEEGEYKDDKKTGMWRKYNSTGDLIAIENYRLGGKDGLQQYYNFLGSLLKEEEWRGYNPDAPYDTIPVYGSGNGEILDYKIVKAEQYSVPHGTWRYFNEDGRIMKIEKYERGRLMSEPAKPTTPTVATEDKPKEKVKTKEILEYEKKYSKKKRNQMERVGKTSL
jgi:hypothetical protein